MPSRIGGKKEDKKMFMQKLRRDKRGLSLIELICAIAILAIISTTIGGAMVFASNSYRHGSVDTALQQETQFAVNAIESLIIDATQTVDFAGGVLTITNTDYTYVITYDAVAQTLRYTQFVTGDPDTVVAENELLASHVTSFDINADEFAVSRNVLIEIGMENGKSSFTSNYNITSRNDASAGDAPDIVAQINCENLLVLEPNQEYILGVSVVRPPDTGYGVSLDGNESIDTTAAKLAAGGVKIKLGATETGGDDATFRLLITTSATDGEGNPFTKWVTIRVRRTLSVDIDSPSLVSGDAFKEGAIYTSTAMPLGSFLAEDTGATYDTGEHAYINPNTIRWSFSMSDGSAASEWMEVVETGTEDNTVKIRLKQDLPTGKGIMFKATALHSHGDQRGGVWSNKASRQNVAKTQYADVFGEVELVKTQGDSLFLRGDDFNVPIIRKLEDIIKADYERNGVPYDPDHQGYNAGYTGNHHIRYKSQDSDSQSVGYSAWKKLAEQGQDCTIIKFNAADLADMRYMETYDLDLVYSFTYQDKDNNTHTYPMYFDPTDPTDEKLHPEDIYSWVIDPIGIVFGQCQTDSNTPINLSEEGYLYEGGKAIGSLNNPLQLTQSHNTKITYTNIGPGSNWKAGVNNLLSARPIIYEWSGSAWVYKGDIQMTNAFDGGSRQTGTLVFGTVNGFTKGKTYKMIIGDKMKDASGNVICDENNVPTYPGQIYTADTGWETYSLNNSAGTAARGLIYFQLN